ncbi:MAG: hypothetical protein K2J29_01455 [Muribaculaceae bacterium]|nr:hypothetical protein [Muribaculaceae bacterium]
MKHTFISIATLILGSYITSQAAEMKFSYADDEFVLYGTGKKENYDVAIHLDGAGLAGYNVRSISVPLHLKVDKVSLWLSTELRLESVGGKKVNAPDIISIDTEVEDGVAAIELPEAYTLSEQGVYIGYSFEVNDISDENGKYPIVVADGVNTPGSFFLHSSRSFSTWTDMVPATGQASALSVTIEGDFNDHAIGLATLESARIVADQSFGLPAVIVNHGLQGACSLSYTYEAGEVSGTGYVELERPLPGKLNASASVELPIQGLPAGTELITVRLTEADGEPDVDSNAEASCSLRMVSFIPERRVVMEEYTGTWCGYCIRGLAAMEALNSRYPDNYIGIAYHRGDPMGITTAFPASIGSLPDSYLDRTRQTDPYFGTYKEGFGIERDFLELVDTESPAAVGISASWQDDNIIATSEVTFVEAPVSNYEVAYVLLENDMYGNTADWLQTNYYYGTDAADYIEEMRQFCEAPELMAGYHYNDVAVMCSNLTGIGNSVTAEIDVPSHHTYTFENISETCNLDGEKIVQNKDQLSVVVLLLDMNDGHIVNAAKCSLNDSGINSMGKETETEIISTHYYDLQGRSIQNPSNNIYIRSDVYSDGTVKSYKVKKN